jgi:tetratricopeptide (TPR) repeat protein
MKKLLLSVLLACAAPLALGNAGMTTPAANAQNADFAAGRQAIERKDWKAAVEALSKAEKSMAGNADLQNYLGYAYRNLDDLDKAFSHYKEALRIDPKHRGAHEYLGETYLKAKQPEKAAEHLAALEKICGKTCEEYRDLAKAIANYGKGR